MKTTYFKTKKAILETDAKLNDKGFTTESASLNCDCGECWGIRVMDDKFKTVEELILCETCYENAPLQQKGE